MKSPSNEGDGTPNEHLLSPNDASNSTGIGLHLIELLAKGVPWVPLNNLTFVKIIGYCPQTDNKAILLKKHLHNSLNVH